MCIRTQAPAYAVSQGGSWGRDSVSTASYYWKMHSPCCISGLELYNLIGLSDAYHACKQRQELPLHEPEPHVGRLQCIGLPTWESYQITRIPWPSKRTCRTSFGSAAQHPTNCIQIYCTVNTCDPPLYLVVLFFLPKTSKFLCKAHPPRIGSPPPPSCVPPPRA